MTTKPIYPRGFLTPEGHPISVRTMAHALRTIRQNPDQEYRGWNWFPTSGHHILAEFRRGLMDRINRRGLAEVTEG